MRTRNQGFSLIELLVVITILGMLAAGGTVFIRMSNKAKADTITRQRLSSIASALETVKQQLGSYPPTETRALRGRNPGEEKLGQKVGVPNETNIGIETLWVAFNLNGVQPDMTGLGDDALANTDNDEVAETVGRLSVPQLYEFVDFWGNPFVYFAARDYKDATKFEKYVSRQNNVETEVKAAPWKSTKTGGFLQEQSFQLFSMGPDGLPNTDDDIGWALGN